MLSGARSRPDVDPHPRPPGHGVRDGRGVDCNRDDATPAHNQHHHHHRSARDRRKSKSTSLSPGTNTTDGDATERDSTWPFQGRSATAFLKSQGDYDGDGWGQSPDPHARRRGSRSRRDSRQGHSSHDDGGISSSSSSSSPRRRHRRSRQSSEGDRSKLESDHARSSNPSRRRHRDDRRGGDGPEGKRRDESTASESPVSSSPRHCRHRSSTTTPTLHGGVRSASSSPGDHSFRSSSHDWCAGDGSRAAPQSTMAPLPLAPLPSAPLFDDTQRLRGAEWTPLLSQQPPLQTARAAPPALTCGDVDVRYPMWRSANAPAERPHDRLAMSPESWSWVNSDQHPPERKRQDLLASLDRLRVSVEARRRHDNATSSYSATPDPECASSSMYPQWWDPAVTAYTDHGPTGSVAAAWKAEMQRLPIGKDFRDAGPAQAPPYTAPLTRLADLETRLTSTRERAEAESLSVLRADIEEQIRRAEARALQYTPSKVHQQTARRQSLPGGFSTPLRQPTTSRQGAGVQSASPSSAINETTPGAGRDCDLRQNVGNSSDREQFIAAWSKQVVHSAPIGVGAPINRRSNAPLVMMHAGNDVGGSERAALSKLTAAVQCAADAALCRRQAAETNAAKAFAVQRREDMLFLEDKVEEQRLETEGLAAVIAQQRNEAQRLQAQLAKQAEGHRGDDIELRLMHKIEGLVAKTQAQTSEAILSQQKAAEAQSRFESARRRAEVARQTFETSHTPSGWPALQGTISDAQSIHLVPTPAATEPDKDRQSKRGKDERDLPILVE